MTLDTKRISTIHPVTGDPQLVISQPGEDADALDPQDYVKLEYHSQWDSVESIIRAGEAEWTNLGPPIGFGTSLNYYAPTLRIDFDDLGFPPIVDFDLIQQGSYVVSGVDFPGLEDPVNIELDGWRRSEEWHKISTGGDDPYLKRIFCATFTDHVTFTPALLLENDFDFRNYKLTFIIWNLPAR